MTLTVKNPFKPSNDDILSLSYLLANLRKARAALQTPCLIIHSLINSFMVCGFLLSKIAARCTNYFLKGTLWPLLMQNSKFVNNFIVIIFMNNLFTICCFGPLSIAIKSSKNWNVFGGSRRRNKTWCTWKLKLETVITSKQLNLLT